VRFAPAKPQVSRKSAVYRTVTAEGLPVTLTLILRPCTKASQERAPLTAEMQVGQETFQGCAAPVPILGSTDLTMGVDIIGANFLGEVNSETLGFATEQELQESGGSARRYFRLESENVALNQASYSGRAEEGGERISITLRPFACRVHGTQYPLSASVVSGGQRFRGCAGARELPSPPSSR
jgi:uncharacterized membrane protein